MVIGKRLARKNDMGKLLLTLFFRFLIMKITELLMKERLGQSSDLWDIAHLSHSYRWDIVR
jgi:hypothetical protein